MDNNNFKYEKLVKLLRKQEPGFEDVQNMADRIMMEIRKEKEHSWKTMNWYDWLFGWTSIGWIRNAMITGMLVVITFFIFQYSNLNRKVSRLEKQLIQSDYIYYQSPYTSKQTLMKYTIPGSLLFTDSIKVSRHDLINLLNDYWELETQSRELPGYLMRDEELHRMFRKNSNQVKKSNKNPSI